MEPAFKTSGAMRLSIENNYGLIPMQLLRKVHRTKFFHLFDDQPSDVTLMKKKIYHAFKINIMLILVIIEYFLYAVIINLMSAKLFISYVKRISLFACDI